MKKNYTLFILVFFSTTFGFSQNQVIGIETWIPNEFGTLSPQKKLNFDFDDAGNEIYNSESYWPSRSIYIEDTERAFDLFNFTEKNYNNDGQILYSFSKNLNTPWAPIKTEEYFYKDLCLEKIIVQESDNERIINQTITHYNTSTCQIDSIEHFPAAIDGNLVKIYLTHYLYTEDSELITKYRRNALGHYNVVCEKFEIFFDDDERPIKIIDYSSQLNLEETRHEYDLMGNITRTSIYVANLQFSDTLYLFQDHTIEYTYNNQDQFIKTVNTHRVHSEFTSPTIISKTITEYLYHCDGLLQQKIVAIEYPSGTQDRKVDYYQYQKGHECEINKDQAALIIRPNITTDAFLIESELLFASNSQISIYDMSGKRIQHFSVSESTDKYYLNIDGLPTGFYIVHVVGGDQQVSKRVAKL